MARPRSFDPDAALGAALAVFWRQGYDGTSLADLVEATGLSRSSLYATWTDKDGLYRAALAHYDAVVAVPLLGPLLTGGRSAIETHLRSFAALAAGDGRGLGCFVVNTAAEFGTDPAMADLVRSLLDRVESAYRTALTTAVDRGELPADLDVDAHAAHLAVAQQALLLQARRGAPAATIDAFVELTLSTLPPEAPCAAS